MDQRNDRSVVLVVVVALALVVLSTIGSGVYLISVGRAVPEAFLALGTTALGGLIGMLANSSTKPTPAQIQASTAPAPVTDPAPAVE